MELALTYQKNVRALMTDYKSFAIKAKCFNDLTISYSHAWHVIHMVYSLFVV